MKGRNLHTRYQIIIDDDNMLYSDARVSFGREGGHVASNLNPEDGVCRFL
jgi:hypothetical protein